MAFGSYDVIDERRKARIRELEDALWGAIRALERSTELSQRIKEAEINAAKRVLGPMPRQMRPGPVLGR